MSAIRITNNASEIIDIFTGFYLSIIIDHHNFLPYI